MDRDILAAAMLRDTNTVNNISYLRLGENTRLLAPGGTTTPESNLSSLMSARQKLQVIQIQLIKEYIKPSVKRFRQARLKLGKNETSAELAAGDLVLILDSFAYIS